jgi:hypothetical protein
VPVRRTVQRLVRKKAHRGPVRHRKVDELIAFEADEPIQGGGNQHQENSPDEDPRRPPSRAHVDHRFELVDFESYGSAPAAVTRSYWSHHNIELSLRGIARTLDLPPAFHFSAVIGAFRLRSSTKTDGALYALS